MNMHIQPTSSKNPHPVDVAVGANVRRLRTAKGMSQEKLGAEALEGGENQLFHIALDAITS